MATWSDLEAELDRWAHPPTFWWRDDDTVAEGPTLDRLLRLSEAHDMPMHLAVIPAHIEPSLRPRLRRAADTWVFQHGVSHVNNEPPGARASEVGEHFPLDTQRANLATGMAAMQAADLPNFLPVLVPPWNRIGDATVAALRGFGYSAVSAYGAARLLPKVPGLARLNAYVDPVRWKEGAQFRGTGKSLGQLVEHLAARRSGLADPDEATGLLTHHLQTDEATWDFLEELTQRLAPRTRWLRASDILGQGA